MTGRAAWGAFGRRLGYDHAAMRTHPPLLLALSLAAPAVAHQFTPTTLPMPVQLTTDSRLGDLDGDGTLEVTLISALGPRVYRHAGNGAMVDLTAGMPAVTGNQRTAAFVDTDGDGSHELLLTWTNSARLFAFGAAGWSERSHLLPPGIPTIHGASAGDLDGDGDQDLVCAGSNLDLGRDQILWNHGAAGFAAAQPFVGNHFQVELCDVDADGDLDLMFARPDLVLYRNDGGGTFADVTAAQLPAGLGSPSSIALALVDGDTTPDLILSASALGDLILTNDGTGLFTVSHGRLPAPSGSTTTATPLDLDLDGDLDLWRGNANFGAPTLLLNDGLGFFTADPSRLPPFPAWYSATRGGDVDGDGDPDLVIAGLGTVASVLWNGHRHLTMPAAPAVGTAWSLEVAAQPGYGTTSRVAVLLVGLLALPQPVLLTPYGRLGIDPSGPLLQDASVVHAYAGPATFVLPVPPLPQLVGLPVVAQALVEDAPGLMFARFTALVATAVQ
jgi:hypothetical protein